jgi:hypothetical protein
VSSATETGSPRATGGVPPSIPADDARHHDPTVMGAWNFNVTFPIADLVFGTLDRGPRATG